MQLFEPWTQQDVLASLMTGCRTMRGRMLVAGYFAERRSWRHPLRPPGLEDGIPLRDLGAPLHVTPDAGGLATYYEIAVRRVYAPDDEWLPKRGETVIDAGANIGVFSLWASARTNGGPLIAIEPNPAACRVLKRNLDQLPAATLHEMACGEAEAVMTLHYVPGKLSIGSLLEREDRTSRVDVPVRPLDAVTDHLDSIDLLKVDVEGFEEQTLRGAVETLKRTRRVVLEVAGTDLAANRRLVERAGLEMRNVVSGMWRIPSRHGVVAHFAR